MDDLLCAEKLRRSAEEDFREQLGRAVRAGVGIQAITAEVNRLAALQVAPAVPPQRASGDALGEQLAACRTKREQVEVLCRLRIRPDDPRTHNAIAGALLEELLAHGIRLDRGAANRYIKLFRDL
ncbi:hypothetical protein OG689_44010 [Kitasatospora sp. NBC_00240]|uniref:hypothetical protein n=1 Tax=Kitasatospora sp. NBC_00240 TaxID=2903567 RepID=UPI0022549E39|nr:hypothetical protein [Kitasatospora sp. NBC_00240]MCX5216102.1 hypothetical protein [Kitasatospora sp. NBC_00240]